MFSLSAIALFLRGNTIVAALGAAAIGIVAGYVGGRIDGNQSARLANLNGQVQAQQVYIEELENAAKFGATLTTETKIADDANDKLENGTLNDAIKSSENRPSSFDRNFLDGVRKLR